MLKHIVMWKIKEEVADKEAVKKRIKESLERLPGIIPQLYSAKVIENPQTSSTHDIALISEVKNEEDLKLYAEHPAHVEVAKNEIKPFACERVCLDYYE